jgi:hypothetical protein
MRSHRSRPAPPDRRTHRHHAARPAPGPHRDASRGRRGPGAAPSPREAAVAAGARFLLAALALLAGAGLVATLAGGGR